MHALRNKILLALVTLVSLLCCSCQKDDDKTFDIYKTWKVSSVSREGEQVSEHQAVGDLYDFQKGGTCRVTRHATGNNESLTWSYDEKEQVLYLDDIRYEVYKTENKAFDFGQIVNGKDVGTLHLVPR